MSSIMGFVLPIISGAFISAGGYQIPFILTTVIYILGVLIPEKKSKRS